MIHFAKHSNDLRFDYKIWIVSDQII